MGLRSLPTKGPVPEIHRRGMKRDEEIELRLRQGLSLLDMETVFQRTADFIAREAARIMGKHEAKKVLGRNKKGKWSQQEISHLTTLRERGLSHTKLAFYLRRTKENVRKTLLELQPTLAAPNIIQGPRELPPGMQQALFEARLEAIWQALLASPMAESWTEMLELTKHDWLPTISEHILDPVKKALGGLDPPTWDDIKSLPLIHTNDAGVYARLATTGHDFHRKNERYIYVGSASKYRGGLSLRIAEHTATKPEKQSRIQRDVKAKKLRSSFVTLMVLKLDCSDPEAILQVRRTVILAEAILTVWLGALQDPKLDLSRECPWDSEILQWTGWSSHNPLDDDLTLPVNYNVQGEDESEC
ncbi:hypothetical protein OPT61_g6341 [Boeremia exigua]|uniref:Uncharacterized protein n=1 Tax=Boeremia exigua TaxID=749465 RepID=A0ACC2I6Y2_9PLEO|nr:hypothetical protein OPT61_g6341 [Boeremia exigua]